jgi:hypothetical protein
MHFFLLLLFVLGVSSHNMTMIEKIKANPKQFVDEMAKVDPTKLKEIIDLLEALRETSHTEESNLLTTLDNAKVATDNAAVAVAGAEEDKKDADDEVVTAQSDLATAKDTAATNIGTATSALDSRRTEANDAQTHLDDMIGAHTARTTEQGEAQADLDAELPALNSEQDTLVNVITILKNLIGSQHDKHMIHNGAGTGNSILTDNNSEHGVRCCSESDGAKWTKLVPGTCPDIWGTSLQDTPDGAWTSQCRRLNWSGAKAACEEIGGRLCTAAEIKADCTTGTGCGLNNGNVWTSSWE